MDKFKDISWWYWMVMVVLLAAGLIGNAQAFHIAIAVGVIQALHYYARHHSLISFPVQVRLSYLGLLIMAQWDPLHFIYWIQLAGTTAMVTADYCPLARFLSLMPWNRSVPFSYALLHRTVFSPPVKGNILQGLPAE
jgi:hypothetical protein